jgi:aconitase B
VVCCSGEGAHACCGGGGVPPSQRHLENYRELLVLEFDEEAAVQYQRLKTAKLRINSMDLKIASIALVHADTNAAYTEQAGFPAGSRFVDG